jgi:hypothetical protein
MKNFIQVTVDKTTGKKGIININNIVFAEPFPKDANATTLYLSGASGQQGSFQVVVDETLEDIISMINEVQP